MTNLEIANHNTLCAELTAGDGIPRLTWAQHRAVFAGPVVALTVGQRVGAWDSATPGCVDECRDGIYVVQFDDAELGNVCHYPATQLRPWLVAEGV